MNVIDAVNELEQQKEFKARNKAHKIEQRRLAEYWAMFLKDTPHVRGYFKTVSRRPGQYVVMVHYNYEYVVYRVESPKYPNLVPTADRNRFYVEQQVLGLIDTPPQGLVFFLNTPIQNQLSGEDLEQYYAALRFEQQARNMRLRMQSLQTGGF